MSGTDLMLDMQVWWDRQDNSIHLTCDDPALTDEHGQRPGLHVVFNANPRSADYNPGIFNRLARRLRELGQAAPEEVAVHPRQLRQRAQVVAAVTGEQAKPLGRPDLALLGLEVCSACSAVVVDLAAHQRASVVCGQELVTAYRASQILKERLGLSVREQMLYSYVKEGRIPSTGGKIKELDLMAWAAGYTARKAGRVAPEPGGSE